MCSQRLKEKIMDGMLIHPVSEMPEIYDDKEMLPLSLSQQYNPQFEYTIHTPIVCSGNGLHTGQFINLKLLPAPAGTGIVFYRSDLGNHPIPARYDHVFDTRLSTVIADPKNSEIRISTVEHLMAALTGMQIDNVIIECDGPELPVLDGSAADYVFLLQCAGQRKLQSRAPILKVIQPIRIEEGDCFAELRPSTKPGLFLSVSIDFPAAIIGKQSFDMTLTPENFKREISYCRTFTFKHEIEHLHKMGLARGGSLDNAIVVEDDKVLNPEGLYCTDEFVRHKMLDVIGDLSLLGSRIQGTFVSNKSGHKINNLLLRKLMSQSKAWCYLSDAPYLFSKKSTRHSVYSTL